MQVISHLKHVNHINNHVYMIFRFFKPIIANARFPPEILGVAQLSVHCGPFLINSNCSILCNTLFFDNDRLRKLMNFGYLNSDKKGSHNDILSEVSK